MMPISQGCSENQGWSFMVMFEATEELRKCQLSWQLLSLLTTSPSAYPRAVLSYQEIDLQCGHGFYIVRFWAIKGENHMFNFFPISPFCVLENCGLRQCKHLADTSLASRQSAPWHHTFPLTFSTLPLVDGLPSLPHHRSSHNPSRIVLCYQDSFPGYSF